MVSMLTFLGQVVIAAPEEPKWTDVGTFVIATIAFLVAAVAAWATVQTNRHQAKQLERLEEADRARQEQEKRAQAEHVWAVVDERALISVHNKSAGPVWNVRVEIFYDSKTKLRAHYQKKAFESRPIRSLLPGVGQVVPDYERLWEQIGEEVNRIIGGVAHAGKLLESGWELESFGRDGETAVRMAKERAESVVKYGVKLTFRDLAGNSWVRHPDGLLELVKE